jgi:chemotaxis protein methyltransferase WspC
MPDELRRIEELLAEQIGLDPVSVGSRLILRAAQHRMHALHLENLSEYERRLYESQPEIQSLIEQVVVPESWFFRDARPYQWFSQHARTRWLREPARPAARMLSLACAGGEEPYSIAMTLSDLGLAACRFQIDAVDISSRQLSKARQGVYSANAFRGSDLSYRSRFFREHPGGFEIDPEIRSMVQFVEANALNPHFGVQFSTYDVIFCRNLLIYLHPVARARVTSVIERLLAADGMVVIGHADRFEWNGTEPKFIAVGDPGCFVHSRVLSVPASRLEPNDESLRVISDSFATEKSTGAAACSQPDGRAITTTSSTDGTTPPSIPANERESLLSQAALLANQGRHALAIATCERDLQLRGHTASAYYLLGVIYQSQGDRPRAEACFHKTVYLDPNHDEALLALALSAERRGEHKAAEGFRRRAARIAAVIPNKVT